MSEVTKLPSVRRPFGPTKHQLFIVVLDTREASQIWKQVHANPICSALINLLNEEPKLLQNIAIGCYSKSANKLIAVDILISRQLRDSPLQQVEFKGEAYGNFIKYLNIIHKHVHANFQEIGPNNDYLTSLGVFIEPEYNSLKIQKDLIFTRKLVARDLRIKVIASLFIGKEIQDIAKSLKYKDLKAFNSEEILQLGLEGLIIREEFPIKIMALKPEINSQINHQTRKFDVPQILPQYGLINVAGAFKVHHTNIRGLKSNIYAVRHHLETEKPHLLFLTESQIGPTSDVAHLNCTGYSLEHNFKRYAGVCVYRIRDGLLNCDRLRRYENENFSTLWLLVETGSHKTIYVGVYRTHSDDQTTELFDHLTEKAKLAQKKYESVELVFLGDFNAHHKEWLFPKQKTNHAGREAHEFAKSLDLHQLVNLPTRIPDVSGQKLNCLDLLLTTHPDRHNVSVWAPLGSSDHCLVESESCCPAG